MHSPAAQQCKTAVNTSIDTVPLAVCCSHTTAHPQVRAQHPHTPPPTWCRRLLAAQGTRARCNRGRGSLSHGCPVLGSGRHAGNRLDASRLGLLLLLRGSQHATRDACTGLLACCATPPLGRTSSCRRVCCSTAGMACITTRLVYYRAAESSRSSISLRSWKATGAQGKAQKVAFVGSKAGMFHWSPEKTECLPHLR